MAPHSSTLAWKIPWREEPGRLQSMGSLRVRHDWATSLSLFTFMHWRRKWQPTPVFLPGESQGQRSLVGCHLWGSHRIGHDWSDLAAAADTQHLCSQLLIVFFKWLPIQFQFSHSVVSDSVRPHRWPPTRLLCLWDSPGKNTGVGCHCLLQCMKVKSESEVTQSWRLLATPWTAAYQAPPSMGPSRQEYWSGVPLPSPPHH